MALLLVLAAVAFISIITVGFLLSMNHELVSSKSYASGASSRIYADAAVNLVIGQLQAGTTQDDTTKTWVSQPGLIRLYDTTGPQGCDPRRVHFIGDDIDAAQDHLIEGVGRKRLPAIIVFMSL